MSWLAERYELGALLGSGGMADVHAATDHLLSRQVAVKVLRDTTETAEDRARFELEARTLARLSHRHLVTVLDAGLDGTHPFLVMELVPGPSLAEVVADGPIALTRVVAIGRGVAEALAYAHGAGVVHRDVKPGNVLLGTGGAVKLADFGIARLLGDTVRHTRTGHAIGTAAYFAPEQVTGQPVTGAADVYALGLVLLESLTGERCYPGPATEAALARLSRPAVVPDDLNPFLADLLSRMTSIEPAARPDAAEVAQRLARTPLRPPPGSRPPPPPRRVPDHTMLRMPAAPIVSPPAHVPSAGPSVQDRLRDVPTERWVIAAVAAVMVLLLVVAAIAG